MEEDTPEPSGSNDLGQDDPTSPPPSNQDDPTSPPPSNQDDTTSPPPTSQDDPFSPPPSNPTMIPLESVCSICSSPAASHLHYGAVCCYSCRAFFRRGISENKKCIYNKNDCQINQFNRTNCKKCRYERCLKFGMKPQLIGAILKRKQEKINKDATKNLGDRTKTSNLSNSEAVNDIPAKRFFVKKECPNDSRFGPTIVPNGGGGEESKLLKERKYIKGLHNNQSSNSGSFKPHGLPYIDQVIQNNQFIKDFKVENEDSHRFIQKSPDKLYSLQIEPEKVFGRHKPVISAYDRLRQDAYFENKMRETIISKNASQTNIPESMPTLLSASQAETILHHYQYSNEEYFTPKVSRHQNNYLNLEDISNTSKTRYYQFGEPCTVLATSPVSYLHNQNKLNQDSKQPAVMIRNSDNKLKTYELRPISIIKYVGTKYDTNLEKVSIPTFDNLIKETAKDAKDTRLKAEIEEDTNTDLSELENDSGKTPERNTDPEDPEIDTIILIQQQFISASGQPMIPIQMQQQFISETDQQLIPLERERQFISEADQELNPLTMQQQFISEGGQPLKKRSRMHECFYPITHAINRKVMPIMPFTCEEEFSIVNYMVRIKKYISMQHNFMKEALGNNLLTTKWVNALKNGHKINYNLEEEKQLFDLATTWIRAKGIEIFPDLKQINNTARNIMLHSTIPTLWVLYLSIMEIHKNSSSGMDQVKQTLYFSEDLCGNNEQRVLTSIQGMSYKDMERFTSPWAENSSDEQKFDRTLSQVGGIISNDTKLHALYHMLVLCSPSKKTPDSLRNDQTLCNMQSGLVELAYRYLANKPGWTQEKAGETVQLLLHLVDELHDCADIMYNRSLVI